MGCSFFMKRFSESQKLKAVQVYLQGKESYRSIGDKIGVDAKSIRKWVALFEQHGLDGLKSRPSCTMYSKMFKLEVLEYIFDTGSSYFEAAARFNISSPYTVSRWIGQLEKGTINTPVSNSEECLSVKKSNQKTDKRQIFDKDSLGDLQNEVEFLRMENAYLKKLNALVQNKDKSLNKTKLK